MASLRQVVCLAGLVAIVAVPASAARHERPEGWNVRVITHPELPKQGLYGYTIRVQDAQGQPVDTAQVHLRLHSFDRDRDRLVSARSVGNGEYRTRARLHPGRDGNPRQVRVVVQP
jgi:hypothetical protein